jgi:hypothetical protein
MSRSLSKEALAGKFFLGKIIDNNDPEKEGRCKIMVYGLYEAEESKVDPKGNPTGAVERKEVDPAAVPWAHPGGRKMFAGGDGGFADISIPKVGTYVQVRFNEGSIYSPEYFSIQTINSEVQQELNDSYLNSHVLAYDVDEELKIFYTPSKGLTLFHKNSQIIINPDSSITIEHKDSESIIELLGRTINIVSFNDVNITAQNCNVDSPNIKLGANAVESVIKGDSFKAIYDSHTHPAAGAPPAIPLPSGVLSKNTKTR